MHSASQSMKEISSEVNPSLKSSVPDESDGGSEAEEVLRITQLHCENACH